MGQDTTRLTIDVSDNGSAARTEEDIAALKAQMRAAAGVAKDLKKEIKSIEGGTTGSKRAAAGIKDIEIYSKQRGVSALTGAAGRDFAAQAQGLDGLVRLYATFAANVFALGAAFRALSTAMETANMVKGLDQLGAAVGKNLGGVSRRVVDLTGGSISLREAMQAVAQTSAGGMSSKNIERLAVVATQASTALGVAMPDAISRLSRGITKLEPELLDELGIMTRLEPATQAYARQVGKAVSQLTDFERRQAFANAVLTEGEAKFGALTDIDANPFNRLLASLKDIVQWGASALNTVLGPVVDILASSPTALAVGITALSGILIKQALPAIGQFRQGLSEAAKASAEIAKVKATDAVAAERQLSSLILREADDRADEYVGRAIDAENRVKALRISSTKESAFVYDVLQKEISQVTDKELRRVDLLAKRSVSKGLLEQASAYREVASSIREVHKREKEYQAEREKHEAVIRGERKGGLSFIALTQKAAVEANTAAIKKGIISNAAYNASIVGPTTAFKIMTHEIQNSTLVLTAFQMRMLQMKGVAVIATGAITAIGGALIKLTNLFAWVGTVAAIFSTLDHFFSSNAKEAAEFSKALDGMTAASENVQRTLAHLEKQMTHGSVAGVLAVATAFEGLNDAFVALVDTTRRNKAELTSFWSFMGNQVSKAWSGDIDSKFRKGLYTGISEAIQLLSRSGLKEEAEEQFKQILDVSNLDFKTIEQATQNLGTYGQDQLLSKINKASTELSNSSSRLQGFKTATEAATRAYQQFIQSTANTTPIFRVGATLQNVGATLFAISKETKLGIQEINAAILLLSEVPDTGALFGEKLVTDLLEGKEAFINQSKAIDHHKTAVIKLNKELQQLNSTQSQRSLRQQGTSETSILQKRDKLKKDKEAIEDAITELSKDQATKSRSLFNSALKATLEEGARLIQVSLGQALEKGAIAIGKASLAGLSGERKATAENALAGQELDIQMRAIETNLNLIIATELLTASFDNFTAKSAVTTALSRGAPAAEIKALETSARASELFYQILAAKKIPDTANIQAATDDEDMRSILGVRGIPATQKAAEQLEARKLLDAQRQALGISGAINVRTGQLEDTQKMLGLEQQLVQLSNSRNIAAAQLVGVSTEQLAARQAELEISSLLLKQSIEMAAVNTAIANAQSPAEIARQEEYKVLTASRHEQELLGTALSVSQKIITAKNEELGRQFELMKATNDQEIRAGQGRLDVLNAENLAFNTLFGIVGEYSATQTAIVASQKAQLDYVKAISDATTDLALKQERARDAVAALDPVSGATEIAAINDELARQEKLTNRTINNAKTNLKTQQAIADVNKKAALQQSLYNRLLSNSSNIADSLSSAFGEVGTAIGGMVEAFGKLTVATDQGVKALIKIREEQSKYKEGDVEFAEKEKEFALQRQKNTQSQILGFANVAGAAKNMFDEQSQGYQVLSAIEKIAFAAHIAMTIKQIAVDAMSVAATWASTTARVGAATVEAEAFGVVAVVKALASLPFPFNFAAGAAVAAMVGALIATIATAGGGKSGSAPSVPVGMRSDDVQSTQGTGRKFINGKLTDTDYGALGASTEKVNDIADSIELIESHTALTSSFSVQTLDALQNIERNTKDLAGTLFRTTNIGKLSSGFGTVERKLPIASSSGKGIEVVDKGISVIGKFSDVMAGIATDLTEYETIQRTKIKSSFFGKTKTKISFETLDKPLESLAVESISDLFTTLATSAITASQEILGSANQSVENVLKDFTVSFKVSGLGLSGEEFAEAILAESSVIMNEIIAKAVPELDSFRKLGEGFTSTLVRLATSVGVVNEKFDSLFGIDFQSLVPGFVAVNQAAMELNGSLEVSADILGNQALMNLAFYNSLVEDFGGLEAFVEKTDYFFENFYSESEQLEAKTKLVTKTLQDFANEGIISAAQLSVLTDGMGNMRAEYRTVIEEVFNKGLGSPEVRSALNILSTFEPAIVGISDAIDDSLSKSLSELADDFDIGYSKFSGLLNDAILGNLDPDMLGSDISEAISNGLHNALAASFIEDVTNTIVNQFISPVLEGVVNAAAINSALATGMLNTLVSDTIAKADALAVLMNDPAFNQAISVLSTSISQIVSRVNTNSKSLNKTFSESTVQEYLAELDELNKSLQSTTLDNLIAQEQTRLDLLEEQADALKESSERFRDFSNNLRDFKTSLLTGQLSPLTPLEKLATARSQLDAAVSAASGAGTSEEKFAALDKIQELSGTFLDISRLVYASGTQYTNDFNFVQSILDSLTNSTSVMATIDEQQLAALQLQIDDSKDLIKISQSQLDTLNDTAQTTTQIEARIAELNELLTKEYSKGVQQISDRFAADPSLGPISLQDLQSSGFASESSLTQIAGIADKNNDALITRSEAAIGGIRDGMVYGSTGQSISLREATSALRSLAEQVANGQIGARSVFNLLQSWGINSETAASIYGTTQREVLDWFKYYDNSIPAFAKGTNFVPEDMLAKIHTGERILPEADNRELMNSLSNRNNTNEQLIVEIQKLNAKITTLEQSIIQGAVINAEATDRNTEEISKTIIDTASSTNHTEAIRMKAGVR